MIWFADILQNTCCNKANENKTKKTLSCVCGVFYTIARTDYVSHHRVLLQTHK